MKKFFLYLTISIFFFVFTSGCENNISKKIKTKQIPALENLYKNAYIYFEKGDWDNSINMFKDVEKYYGYTEWAQKASYLILYMYYEANEPVKALEYAKKIKKLYPTSKNMDYVEYIIGLIFYEEINSISRDQENSKLALKQFNKILNKYPNSIYAPDVRLKIDLINQQLAGKQMYLARYYISKSKWIPAIKRLKIIIKDYDTSIYTQEALHRLVEIYYKLGNYQDAKKYAAILGYNFNSSQWYKKSYKILGDKNYLIENKKQKKNFKKKILDLFKFSK